MHQRQNPVMLHPDLQQFNSLQQPMQGRLNQSMQIIPGGAAPFIKQ